MYVEAAMRVKSLATNPGPAVKPLKNSFNSLIRLGGNCRHEASSCGDGV